MHLDGKVFLVTGGASGLGEGAARALAAKGVHVAIIDRDVEAGQEIADELRGSFVEVDMCETASIEAAVAAVAAKCGRIDGCVNCAGTGMGQLVVNRKDRIHSAEDFEFIIKLNLVGTFVCAAQCAAHMVKNAPEDDDGERGVIINVASVAAFDGQNGQAAYSASKAGVVGMALPMARDLGPRGVRVMTIAPGTFSTALTAPIDHGESKVGESLRSQQVFPVGRFGMPSEFAHAVVFIAENKMMTGECIRLDGGIRMPKL